MRAVLKCVRVISRSVVPQWMLLFFTGQAGLNRPLRPQYGVLKIATTSQHQLWPGVPVPTGQYTPPVGLGIRNLWGKAAVLMPLEPLPWEIACPCLTTRGQRLILSWGQRETGNWNSNDYLYFAFYNSITGWSSNIEAFHDDNPPSSFSYPIPNNYLTDSFKMRFFLSFSSSSRYVYIDNIKITANVLAADNHLHLQDKWTAGLLCCRCRWQSDSADSRCPADNR